MPLWIPITLTAALFQTWRTALQQRLRGRFSVGTAGLVRYVYAVPVGAALLMAYAAFTHAAVPGVTTRFLLGCLLCAVAQIMGTSLLIMAFGYRNFAVGTAYSKTDAMQAALVAWLVLGETLAPGAWAGIGLGLFGVLTLSLAGQAPGTLLRATVQPAALCGLGAGAGFAMAGVGIKIATAGFGTDPILAALCALVTTNILQTLLQGGFMAWREPAGLRAAFTGWRAAMWVGVLSACGSACWFSGFALAPVALVRTVGQTEMVFTLLFSRFYLRETLRRADVLGLALIVGGVVLVLLFH